MQAFTLAFTSQLLTVMTGLQTIWGAVGELAVSPFIKEPQSPIRNSLVWCLLLSMFACYPSAIWLWSKTVFQSGHKIVWRLWISAHSNWTSLAIRGSIQEFKQLIYRVDEWTFIWCSKCFVDSRLKWIKWAQREKRETVNKIGSYSFSSLFFFFFFQRSPFEMQECSRNTHLVEN